MASLWPRNKRHVSLSPLMAGAARFKQAAASRPVGREAGVSAFGRSSLRKDVRRHFGDYISIEEEEEEEDSSGAAGVIPGAEGE